MGGLSSVRHWWLSTIRGGLRVLSKSIPDFDSLSIGTKRSLKRQSGTTTPMFFQVVELLCRSRSFVGWEDLIRINFLITALITNSRRAPKERGIGSWYAMRLRC